MPCTGVRLHQTLCVLYGGALPTRPADSPEPASCHWRLGDTPDPSHPDHAVEREFGGPAYPGAYPGRGGGGRSRRRRSAAPFPREWLAGVWSWDTVGDWARRDGQRSAVCVSRLPEKMGRQGSWAETRRAGLGTADDHVEDAGKGASFRSMTRRAMIIWLLTVKSPVSIAWGRRGGQHQPWLPDCETKHAPRTAPWVSVAH
jgi:hypothetical protein